MVSGRAKLAGRTLATSTSVLMDFTKLILSVHGQAFVQCWSDSSLSSPWHG